MVLGLPLGGVSVAYGWTEFNRVNSFLLLPWAISFLWGIQQRESGHRASLLQSAWQGIRLWPRMLGFQFISGLALICATICLLFPAVYVWVSLSVGTALIVAHGQTVDATMTRSFELTKPHFWRLLFFWVCFGALSGFLMFGSLSLLDTLEFLGLVGASKFQGWPTSLWTLLVEAQLVALGHLAGMAVLRQILPGSELPENLGALGLNPVVEAE